MEDFLFSNLNFYLHVDFFKSKTTMSTVHLSGRFNDHQKAYIIDLNASLRCHDELCNF